MKKTEQKAPEERFTPELPETKEQPVRFFFSGREYSTDTISEEERKYLRQFPDQVPYKL